jgi:5'-nucleotidase
VTTNRPARTIALATVAALALFVVACSDDGGGSSTSDTGSAGTDAPPEDDTLDILVSNDDGVDGEGLDVLVERLREIPNAEVTVYAPADEQSGMGDNTTAGTLTTFDTETLSGYPAVAVRGTPADSVNTAFDQGVEPDVVVTGINYGPNLGEVAEEGSGTIGAARAAANEGVPALAVSQGLGEPPDFEAGADVAADWVVERQDALVAGDEPVELVSINVPTCTTGSVRGPVEAPLAVTAAEGSAGPIDCAAGTDAQTDDSVAFVNGYASITILELD